MGGNQRGPSGGGDGARVGNDVDPLDGGNGASAFRDGVLGNDDDGGGPAIDEEGSSYSSVPKYTSSACGIAP